MQYILARVSACLLSAGVVLETLLGWPLWLSITVLLSITFLYVLLGGMAAVIYTEVMQTGVLILASVLLTILSLGEVIAVTHFSQHTVSVSLK